MPGFFTEWRKHDGSGVPVPVGTLVHVKTNDDMLLMAADRKLSKVGVVGRDFWESWHWAAEGRLKTQSLPIDWYRVWLRESGYIETAAQADSGSISKHRRASETGILLRS